MEELVRMYLEQKKSNVVDIGKMTSYMEELSPQELSNVLALLVVLLLMIRNTSEFTPHKTIKVATVIGTVLCDAVEEASTEFLGMSLQQALLKATLWPEVDTSVLTEVGEDTVLRENYTTKIMYH